jgi:hypothetical protein
MIWFYWLNLKKRIHLLKLRISTYPQSLRTSGVENQGVSTTNRIFFLNISGRKSISVPQHPEISQGFFAIYCNGKGFVQLSFTALQKIGIASPILYL